MEMAMTTTGEKDDDEGQLKTKMETMNGEYDVK